MFDWKGLITRVLVRVLLIVSIAGVELFNSLDDGPVDYEVVKRESPGT